MKFSRSIIIDSDGNMIQNGELGELCLSGQQLTPGYWRNERKNKEAFFNVDENNRIVTYYRTGDLCSYDEDGDLRYHGRSDSQAKVQGFRVELSEIEYYAKRHLNKINAVAIDFKNKLNNTEIGLVIESKPLQIDDLKSYLKEHLPIYMIPTKIEFLKTFPLNRNEKIDRNKLRQLFKQ